MSAGTVEVLRILEELLPGLTKELFDFCAKHVARRNAELHTGEDVFAGLGTSVWLPRFFACCKVLLESMGKGLGDLFSDPAAADQLIESLQDEAAKAVQQDIKAHQQVWGNKSDDERDKLKSQATMQATRHNGHRVSCPACGCQALVYGSPQGPVATDVGEDEIVQRQTMLPSSFECVACRLRIVGLSKLLACGLGDAFTATSTYSAADFFELHTPDELEEARGEWPAIDEDFNE